MPERAGPFRSTRRSRLRLAATAGVAVFHRLSVAPPAFWREELPVPPPGPRGWKPVASAPIQGNVDPILKRQAVPETGRFRGIPAPDHAINQVRPRQFHLRPTCAPFVADPTAGIAVFPVVEMDDPMDRGMGILARCCRLAALHRQGQIRFRMWAIDFQLIDAWSAPSLCAVQ